METSPEIKAISAAILEAQKNTGAAIKDARNPFFKSTYADLGAVMEVCKNALNNAGITCLQPVVSEGDATYVETYLIHSSGEWFKSRQRIVCKAEHDPQAQGSAITYAKRYSLQSLLFIPSEDDDGNRATKPAPTYNCPPGGQPVEPKASSLPPLAPPAGSSPFSITGMITKVGKKKSPLGKIFFEVCALTEGGLVTYTTESETLATEAKEAVNRPGSSIMVERDGDRVEFLGVAPF